MKTFNRFWIWLGLPALLGTAVYLHNPDLARVAAVLMWVTLVAVGITCTLCLAAMLALKPTSPSWEESKATWLKEKRRLFARICSWISLFTVVVLAAYTGFAVTAAFYFIISLWTRLCIALIEQHFTRANEAAE